MLVANYLMALLAYIFWLNFYFFYYLGVAEQSSYKWWRGRRRSRGRRRFS